MVKDAYDKAYGEEQFKLLVKLYDNKRLTLAEAAEEAGMPEEEFLQMQN